MYVSCLSILYITYKLQYRVFFFFKNVNTRVPLLYYPAAHHPCQYIFGIFHRWSQKYQLRFSNKGMLKEILTPEGECDDGMVNRWRLKGTQRNAKIFWNCPVRIFFISATYRWEYREIKPKSISIFNIPISKDVYKCLSTLWCKHDPSPTLFRPLDKNLNNNSLNLQ